MQKSAVRLVEKLAKLGYHVHGVSFQILRDHGQPYLNKLAGGDALCWGLLVDPLYNTTGIKIIVNGNMPVIDLPDGSRVKTEVCSHFPLLHILRTPVEDWDVFLDDDSHSPRLIVTTTMLPATWQ